MKVVREIAGSMVWLAAASLLAGACAPKPAPVVVPTQRAPAAPALACEEVAGLGALFAPGGGVLFGEMHGTEQSPAFVANAVCLALSAGLQVTMALEIPREETSRVDVFLASAGGEKDREALLAGPFWRADYQDGRRSQAMFALLERLRQFHRDGKPVRAELLDRAVQTPTSAERDRRLAEALGEAFDKTPDGVVIGLLGDVHTRVRGGVPWDPNYVTAGSLLLQQKPELRLTTLLVSYRGGEAWICLTAEASSCQIRSVKGRAGAQADGIEIFPEITNGHNGVYYVGDLHASPPMVAANLQPRP
ncbi:MAG TPA: hypothetical protein VGS22_04280 [Thermoanaerobaculia bacterium]|jgi:hypothetical protein|nr:hypothetical protein [Thermoanaerobaculia bacterium]